MLIGENAVVTMHYTLTDESGTVLDSSEEGEPMDYLHGAGNIIPGLEQALAGKRVGDALQVQVEPDAGYGPVEPELIQVVERGAFQGVDAVEAGMAFEARAQDGEVRRIVVREVNGDEVTIDGNHPLAGMTLHFDIEIVAVRAATAEEVAHGHVH
jgi:FKBP-type peptidyl-prolyl cis-trans isomerase SlyD